MTSKKGRRIGINIFKFEDFIDEELLRILWININKYFNQILKYKKPTVVVGLQRKGKAILEEIEEELPIPIPYKSVNEDLYEERSIEDQVIVIFDDSCNSGSKLIKKATTFHDLGAKKIILCPLLITEETKELLSRQKVVTEVYEFTKFKSYGDLQDYYELYIIPLMGSLTKNINNQFDILQFTIKESIDLTDLAILCNNIKLPGDSKLIIEKETEIPLITVSNKKALVTYVETDNLNAWIENSETESKIDYLEYFKIRWYIVTRKEFSTITLVPMFVPILKDLENCEISHSDCPFSESDEEFLSHFSPEKKCLFCVISQFKFYITNKILNSFQEVCKREKYRILKEEIIRATPTGTNTEFDLGFNL